MGITYPARALYSNPFRKMLAIKVRETVLLPVYLARHPDLYFLNKNLLFVLSHMRGYTTLLSHILGSHEKINGHAESHLQYQMPFARFRLFCRVQRQTGGLNGDYVLDKILHNRIEIPEWIIQKYNATMLVTIRRPQGALPSIAKLHHDEFGIQSPEDSCNYYIERIKKLAEFCRTHPNAIFFEAERLMDDTENLLGNLTGALKLENPLRQEYRTFEQTGQPGLGDSSQYIAKGEIVRSREHHNPVLIPDELMQKAEQAYIRCVADIRNSCHAL